MSTFIYCNTSSRRINQIAIILAVSLLFLCFQSAAQTTVTSQVSTGNDDAEQRISTGAIDLTSTDLELTSDGGNNQYVGMRFNNVNVPQGAYITNAYLTFQCDEADAGVTNVVIAAQAADNAATFTNTAFSISTRPLTTATATWNSIPAWTVNTNYNSDPFPSVVQEVVNRLGWAANNSMVIIITGNGERTAESYNGEAANAPILTITYEICTAITDPTYGLGASSSRCQAASSVIYSASSVGSTSISYALDATSLAAGNTINSATGEVSYVAGWSGVSTITATALGCHGPKVVTHDATTSPSSPTVSFSPTLLTGRCIAESTESYAADPLVGADIIYTIDATSLAGGVTIEDTTGSVYFPDTWSGVTTVTATATSLCGSSSANHMVTTGDVVAQDDQGFCGLNGTIVTTTTTNDLCDIDPSTVTIISGPSNGALVVGPGGVITYTPTLGYSGTDSYVYEVCGLIAPGVCSQATVNLTVSPYFADEYFNSIPSNCEYVPTPQAFTMEVQYEIPTPIALYANSQVGDIDGDGVMEIVSLSATNLSTANPRRAENIYIFSGADGTLETTINTPFLSFDGGTPFAIADIDDDGDGEIIVAAMDDMGNTYNNGFERRLVCYDHTGTQLWISSTQYGINHHNGTNQAGSPSVGIADFNQDGTPEVYVYNEIFNALTGVKLCDGGANGVGNQHDYRNQQPGITVAADLRPSAGLELAAGPTVYDVTITNTSGTAGNSMVANNFAGVAGTMTERDGFTAIADINLDGVGDVIVMGQNGNVYAYNPVGMTLIAQRTTASGASQHGALFIGDVDGDGSPNIGYCRQNRIDMLSYNGTANFQLKWTLTVVDGSARTNLTMFDFNQDGTQEIIYRDETTLRVFDGSGAAPVVLISLPSFSDTAMEGPVVADVDNDGSAEIIVTTESSAADSDRIGRIQVFRSTASPWAPARKVWNQYAYYNTHVEDDLSIPQIMPKHWEAFFSLPTTCPLTFQSRPLNTFNVQSTYYSNIGCPEFPVPDAAITITSSLIDCATNIATINYIVSNLGDEAVLTAPISISFYQGNPTLPGATLLSTQSYVGSVGPLSSTGILSFFQAGVLPGSTIYAVVNDDGSMPPPISFPIAGQDECNYTNNIVAFTANCPSVLPVELVNFGVVKSGDEALITWETLTELNNDYFVVEQSLNGIDFRDVASVDGAGTTTAKQSYSAIDKQPFNGINYYRLRQVDFDGKVNYSDIRSLDFSKDNIVIYPNPANEMVSIANPLEESQLSVKDLFGKEILKIQVQHGISTISTMNLSSGLYLFEFTDVLTGSIEVIKVRIY